MTRNPGMVKYKQNDPPIYIVQDYNALRNRPTQEERSFQPV